MKRHFLLFMALFALASVNNLFASGEASSHKTDGTINPENQNLTALALPISINSITNANYKDVVWFPTATSDPNLVYWKEDEGTNGSMIFSGKDAGYSNDNSEHPFVIKLAEAAKSVTVDLRRPSWIGSNTDNDGGAFYIYEWDGTGKKWVEIASRGSWQENAQMSANISASTEYLMIAPHHHAGATRKLYQLDVASLATLSPDKSTLAFAVSNKSAQTVVVSNSKTSVLPSVSWKNDTGKFSYTTEQTGTAETGQTTITITPNASAAAGDLAILTVTAGTQTKEIPIVVYDDTNKSLSLDLTNDGSVSDAIRFIGMCTHDKTNYDFGTKSAIFEAQSDNGTKRNLIVSFTDVPLKLTYTIQANQESKGFNQYNKPKIKTYQSIDGTSWTQMSDNESEFNGTKNKTFDLSSSTRYIKFEFYNIKGIGTLSNLKITKLDPTPAFTLVSSQDWGSQSVNKSVAKNIAPTGLNEAAQISTWSAEITGTNAGMFAVTSCNASTGACVITYTPTEAGLHSATLTLKAKNNNASPAVETAKTVALSGTGDAAATIELTKQGEVTPSTSHDFGSVIGLNAATPLVLNVFSTSLAEGPVVEWKSQDDAFNFTKNNNAITITAQPAAAQNSASNHQAVLSVKGKSSGSAEYDVIKEFTVTLTVNPRTIPTKTWNIGETLYSQNVYSNIFTTNSDAQLTYTLSDNTCLTYADNKLTTGTITTSPQAAGTITVFAPATATYEAINEVRAITLVSNPAYLPFLISGDANNSGEELFNLLYSSSESKSCVWTNDYHGIRTENYSNSELRNFALIFKGAPLELSFDYLFIENEGKDYIGDIYYRIDWKDDQGNWHNGENEIVNCDASIAKNPHSGGRFDYNYGGEWKHFSMQLDPSCRGVRIGQGGVWKSAAFKNIQVTPSTPTLTVAESAIVLKKNDVKVYDKTVNISVLKYSTIKAKVEDAGFALVKGNAAAASEITFTTDDGLNDNTFTDCSFKVTHTGEVASAIGQTATVKFYDESDNLLAQTVAVSIAQVEVLTFEATTNGTYTYKYGSESAVTVSTTNKTRDLADAPYEVTLTAKPSSDYKLLAWYEMNDGVKTYVSTSTTYTPTITTTKTIGVDYLPSTTPVFIVKGQDGYYFDLTAACTAAASSTSKTVVLVSSGTLDAGNYEIPSNITLLIPFDDAYTCCTTQPATEHANPSASTVRHIYRYLTMASGAHIDVCGAISVSAKRTSGNGGQFATNSILDYHGLIDMLGTSSITVKNNGNLYVWGYITSSDYKTNGNKYNSSIIVENGGTVYEAFQFTDHHGGGSMSATYQQVFLVNQYYIQSIENPLTLLKGAKEKTFSNFYIDPNQITGSMTFMGSDGLFLLSDNNAKVTKQYNPVTDRILYDVYGQVQMDHMEVTYNGQGLNTKNYILPLTNNMDITIHSGSTTTIPYDASMLPDSKIVVEQGATLNINNTFFVYDSLEWCYNGRSTVSFAQAGFVNPVTHTAANKTSTTSIRNVKNGHPELVNDAKLLVNGTLNVSGYLMSTATGGNICSEQEGAQIILSHSGTNQTNGSASGKSLKQVHSTEKETKSISTVPAMLKNSDGSYVSTTGDPAEKTYVYAGGKWLVKKATESITVDDKNVTINEEEENISNATYQISNEAVVTEDVAITKGATIEVTNNASLEVSDTIKVTEGSTLEVETTASVSAGTLALSTTPTAIEIPEQGQGTAGTSSQIKGGGTITAANVFIDITMDPTGKLDGSKYYAFAVPFAVNVNGGVQKKIGNQLSPCVHNTHFRAYTYNGANRAANGKGSNWVLVNTATFQPGVFYLVEFADGSCNTFRFTKASGEGLNNAANITLDQNPGSNQGDAGWNGIANNSLQNASISLSSTGVAQIFDPAQNAFVTINLGNTLFAIGTPLFVQVGAAGVTANNSAVAQNTNAPARMLAQTDDETFGNYTVRIKAEGATKMADQMFISASENAESSYVIGKDLTKMFMGNASVAQLWVNDYGKKLSMNQTVLTNDMAVASLTLYAPKAGNYQVYLKDIPEDATLYLLKNGQAVANLNEGAATVSLAKGENALYGLRINAVRTLPGVVTSIDEALVGGDLQKVLLDGVVYIVRDGKLFTVLGQER